MAKMMTFIITISVLMLLFNLSGMIDTTSGYILGTLGILDHTQDIKSSHFYTAMLVALGALVLTSSIRIGFFGVSVSDTSVAAGLALIMGTFVGDVLSIITGVKGVCPFDSSCGWVSYLVIIILAPIILGLAISIFDWARGND